MSRMVLQLPSLQRRRLL
uniref:Uncharacterized protein n=1 Tax=Rhizophora mucronata TaxID=61149 RepID=A0A2P2NTF9_RHIMU